MAPAVSRADSDKVSLSIGHPQHQQLREAMLALRNKVTSEADYVGDKFAEEARKIHFKEVDPRGIYGEATREEVAGARRRRRRLHAAAAASGRAQLAALEIFADQGAGAMQPCLDGFARRSRRGRAISSMVSSSMSRSTSTSR